MIKKVPPSFVDYHLTNFSCFIFAWHAGGASQNDYVYDESSG